MSVCKVAKLFARLTNAIDLEIFLLRIIKHATFAFCSKIITQGPGGLF